MLRSPRRMGHAPGRPGSGRDERRWPSVVGAIRLASHQHSAQRTLETRSDWAPTLHRVICFSLSADAIGSQDSMATSCPNACSRRSASLKERRCALFLGPQSEREGFRYQVAGQTGHDGPLRPLRRSAMSASAHASYSSRLLFPSSRAASALEMSLSSVSSGSREARPTVIPTPTASRSS